MAVIVTTNVRGLRDPTKRAAVFAFLGAMRGDIFLLQEAHLRDEEDAAALSREWVWGPSGWSVGSVHSDGVGILFRGPSFVVEEVVVLVAGRVMYTDFLFSGVKFRVVNVYAPAQRGRRLEVFRDLPGCLSTTRSLILGGDFNVRLDGRDGAGEGGTDYSARALAEVVRDFSLVDAYRASHPSDAGFTWRNSRGAASRLDYIFVGGGQSGMKCVLLPSWASDHDMLRVSLPADGPKWGPGFWRLNTSLLGSGAFVKAFTRCYSTVRALRPLYTSVVEWWEAAKSRFASFCRLHAVGARRRDGAEVTKWTEALAYLHGRLNRGESVDWAANEGAKERLRGLLEARAKALAFQARLRELEEGERPTAYFFQAARARRGASAIAGLRRVDGTLAEGQAMLAVAESYYAELFSRRACDPAAEARLLACVSARLGAEEAQAMEADVTLEEVREALMGLRDGRAPGHDGLPKEFYVAFWHLLGPDLLEVYRTLLKGGALSASMQKGVLVLLHKGGDRAELGNWWPLTLLTTDYKVLAKVATARLRRVMGGLVSQDQTCGVPGRSCSWNLILLRDVLDWVDERNLPLALVSIDQEKAFDRVQHGFLFGVLGRMGFGPRFIGWVRTLYAGAYSCVRVNGFLSGAVEQAGGVRQGCPLSPLLYVLFMEPFAELVRRDPGVDGVRLPGVAGEVLKIQQYADDTTLFVSSVRSLGRIRALTDLFGAGTGSRVNMAKSSVLFCGSWTEDIGDSEGFAVCEGGLKILGVRFWARGSAAQNWKARLTLVRSRLGMWSRRQLSLTGKVIVVRSVLLPLLLHLAYVFPVPARAKLALTRAVFRFLWGGRYEYVSRELMYAPVAGGGGVSRGYH
ncbi:hypothetical protein AAFF_G00361900 [Aldrovandia affinis]|uniref:Reverse transcriptase domain-containing protein n=1 Tax=Aldrovandia affinis TaxID=143900 RepID=A0AAD7SJY7_9TELE|nr:hypothetical protein AAFF_G00361900 [Aldrovandia affinis]